MPSNTQSTGIRNLQKTAVSKGKNRLVSRDKRKEGRKRYREKKKGSQNVLYKHYRNVKRSQITIILSTQCGGCRRLGATVSSLRGI